MGQKRQRSHDSETLARVLLEHAKDPSFLKQHGDKRAAAGSHAGMIEQLAQIADNLSFTKVATRKAFHDVVDEREHWGFTAPQKKEWVDVVSDRFAKFCRSQQQIRMKQPKWYKKAAGGSTDTSSKDDDKGKRKSEKSKVDNENPQFTFAYDDEQKMAYRCKTPGGPREYAARWGNPGDDDSVLDPAVAEWDATDYGPACTWPCSQYTVGDVLQDGKGGTPGVRSSAPAATVMKKPARGGPFTVQAQDGDEIRVLAKRHKTPTGHLQRLVRIVKGDNEQVVQVNACHFDSTEAAEEFMKGLAVKVGEGTYDKDACERAKRSIIANKKAKVSVSDATTASAATTTAAESRGSVEAMNHQAAASLSQGFEMPPPPGSMFVQCETFF